jgi:serine/threonine protein kinase
VSDVPQDLGAALGARYDTWRVLGRGGMATVYLAYDRKHLRQVAVKVLRPDLAASLGAERFLREIQIAARLTHPHILALHDSGEAGGYLYYVMPFIDGPSLRVRLDAERRFEPAEALAIGGPVADALGYAHRMGVFHRDIKPENILFSQGHPIVADFGIAKAIVTAGGMSLTRTGYPLGTPGYMSPEQAAGLTDLDEKTDVYSLAVVIYEMLVGQLPGRWPSEDALRSGRFLEAPAAHRERLARAGSVIEAALVRGMAIRHEQRTATPRALLEELTGVAAARRRYREDEVREIVKRAAEAEASNPTASGAMTVGGIEALAAEVGIAPEAVREAARAVARNSAPRAPARPEINKPNFWLGAPTRLMYERVVEGEVPDAEFPALVEEIRVTLNRPGQVSQLGRTFSWTSAGSPGSTRAIEVSVAVRGGRTRISVREGLGSLIGGIYGGIGGGMGGGGMGPVIALFAGWGAAAAVVAVIPFWLATTFSVARTSYHYAVRRRQRELQGLVDRLAQLAEELVPKRPALDAPAQRLLP